MSEDAVRLTAEDESAINAELDTLFPPIERVNLAARVVVVVSARVARLLACCARLLRGSCVRAASISSRHRSLCWQLVCVHCNAWCYLGRPPGHRQGREAV